LVNTQLSLTGAFQARICTKNRVSTEPEDLRIVKTSEMNGFRLFKGFEDSSEQSSQQDPDSDLDLQVYEVLLEDREIQYEVQELFEDDEPSSDDIEVGEVAIAQQSCLNTCTTCIGIIGGACPACLAFLTFGVPGAVAFIICFTSVCGITLPVFCGQCLDCGT
jgi:hypothetical protein